MIKDISIETAQNELQKKEKEGEGKERKEKKEKKENEITESLTHNFRSITCIGK